MAIQILHNSFSCQAPHQSFEQEIGYLQEIFSGGEAYALGRLTGQCWYLYTLNPQQSVTTPDQTLEIIMTKLDPEVWNAVISSYYDFTYVFFILFSLSHSLLIVFLYFFGNLKLLSIIPVYL